MTQALRRPTVFALLAMVLWMGLAAISPADAAATRCKAFVYVVNLGPIQIYSLRTRNVSCARARRLIRAGSPPASTYNWIGSYRCGPGYNETGYKCRQGSRTIEWRWRLRS